MDESELLDLFLQGEADRIERKELFYETKEKICRLSQSFFNFDQCANIMSIFSNVQILPIMLE